MSTELYGNFHLSDRIFSSAFCPKPNTTIRFNCNNNVVMLVAFLIVDSPTSESIVTNYKTKKDRAQCTHFNGPLFKFHGNLHHEFRSNSLCHFIRVCVHSCGVASYLRTRLTIHSRYLTHKICNLIYPKDISRHI